MFTLDAYSTCILVLSDLKTAYNDTLIVILPVYFKKRFVIAGTCFSGERCDPWTYVFCLFIIPFQNQHVNRYSTCMSLT